MQGWISIYREIQDHWIWENEKYLKWWLAILMNVNHEAKKFPVGTKIYTCRPGESFKSIQQWTAMFGCSKKTTLKFFGMLAKDQMIIREILGEGNRRKHLLTVVNWEKFQKKGTKKETETVPENTPKQYQNVSPNNNENNGKNGNNTPSAPEAGARAIGDFYLTKKKRKLSGERLKTFLIFWEIFDYKIGKAEAADSWFDIPELTDFLCNQIFEAAKLESSTRSDLNKTGRTPKMAHGWLSARRWEDEKPEFRRQIIEPCCQPI